MKKFLVMYLVPAAVIEGWSKTDADTRKPAEEKMRAAWDAWIAEHGDQVSGTEVGCKTKRVSPEGIADTRNDILLYAFARAETLEAAAKLFENHPHLGIPQSSIEVMEVRQM